MKDLESVSVRQESEWEEPGDTEVASAGTKTISTAIQNPPYSLGD